MTQTLIPDHWRTATAEQVLARRAFDRALIRQDRALEIAATFVIDLADALRITPARLLDEIGWRIRRGIVAAEEIHDIRVPVAGETTRE